MIAECAALGVSRIAKTHAELPRVSRSDWN